MRIIKVVVWTTSPEVEDRDTATVTRKSADGTYDVETYPPIYRVHVDLSELSPSQRTALTEGMRGQHWSVIFSTYADFAVIVWPVSSVDHSITTAEEAAEKVIEIFTEALS